MLVAMEETDLPVNVTGPAVGAAARAALTTRAYLAAERGPDIGVCLPGSHLEVGRGTWLIDRQLSRRHFALKEEAGRLWVRDLGSTNGSFSSGFWRRRRVGGDWLPLHRFLWAGRGRWRFRRRPVRLRVPQLILRPTRSRSWLSFLPLVISLPLMVAFRPWLVGPLLVTVTLGFGLWWLARRSNLRPDSVLLKVAGNSLLPAALLRQPASSSPPGVGAWLGLGWWRGPALRIRPGQRLVLTGYGATNALHWWLAQVLASGQVSVNYRGKILGYGPFHIEVVGAGSEPSLGVIPNDASGDSNRVGHSSKQTSDFVPHAWIGATEVASLPAWAEKVVRLGWFSRRFTSPRLPSSHWWQGVSWLAHRSRADGEDRQLPRVTTPPEPPYTWSEVATNLAVPVGVSADGEAELDLVSQGPHALVAGTTGSGKSEFLVTWVLQMAARFSPAALNFILVDFKGGAAFGPLVDLPHTTGMLTDLDYQNTARALSSLRAELRSRERLFACWQVRDFGQAIRDLPGLCPARLVVVIDEFRELGTAHPELLDQLTSLATLGRSLGIHLVLATQRPAGIVDSQIRANTNLRICLRVLSAADSNDVLGQSGAEALPAIPGRALIAADSVTPVQFFWHRHPAAAVTACLEKAKETASDDNNDSRQVIAPPRGPWLEPLPSTISDREVESRYPLRVGTGAQLHPDATNPNPEPGTPLLGLADYPLRQEQSALYWDWSRPLLIVGANSSGKTFAVTNLAKQLGSLGKTIFIGTNPPPELSDFTTVITPSQNRLCKRAVELATTGALDALVVDDVETLLATLESGRNWQAATHWEELVRRAGSHGLKLVLTASPLSMQSRWATGLTQRLVLGLRDRTQCAQLGLSDLHSQIRIPGRGCLYGGGEETWLQISESTVPASFPPPLLRELPFPFESTNTRVVGAGGDRGEPIFAEAGSYIVLGRAGSGRTHTLKRLQQALPELVLFDDFEADPSSLQKLTEAVQEGKNVAVASTSTALRTGFSLPLNTLIESATVVALGEEATKLRTCLPNLDEFQNLGDPPVNPKPGSGFIRRPGSLEPIQISL